MDRLPLRMFTKSSTEQPQPRTGQKVSGQAQSFTVERMSGTLIIFAVFFALAEFVLAQAIATRVI